jgi:hypothetical protein
LQELSEELLFLRMEDGSTDDDGVGGLVARLHLLDQLVVGEARADVGADVDSAAGGGVLDGGSIRELDSRRRRILPSGPGSSGLRFGPGRAGRSYGGRGRGFMGAATGLGEGGAGDRGERVQVAVSVGQAAA